MTESSPGPRNKNSSQPGGDRELWKYATLGTQLTLCVILFLGVGWWFDQHFGWTPWGMTILGMLGICVAMYQFLKESLR